MNTNGNEATRRSFVWWGGRIMGALFALLAALVVVVLIGGALVRARIKSQYPPPGRMVDVGGYSLHVNCRGEGSPAVVLISGSGAPSSYWHLVQSELAEFTRVCVYDRAGYAWSEAGTDDMSPRGQVEDLKLLLEGADVMPPYVLVGHSYGGYIGRLYAHTHPGDVVGLVMVDSAHEEQYTRFPEPIRAMGERMFTGPDSQMGRFLFYLLGSLQALLPGSPPEADFLPPDVAGQLAAMRKLQPLILYTVKAEVSEMVTGRSSKVASLGDVPLVVITAGIPTPLSGQSAADNAEYARISLEMQRELGSLSTKGRQVIAADATHDELPLKRADLVVGSVKEVMAEALAQGTLLGPRH